MIALAVLAALASPVAGSASAPSQATLSEEARACVVEEAPQGLAEDVATALSVKDAEQSEPVFVRVLGVADGCAVKYSVPGGQFDAYFLYAVGRLSLKVIAPRLAATGIPSDAIDSALGLGGGGKREGRPAMDLDAGDWNAIDRELCKHGLHLDRLDEGARALIASYAAAASFLQAGEAGLLPAGE